ncbi:MAG: carboxymuconolactone decarboxylase family protein [Clostridiales bacterium]|nr:carboxymuconolactone decarboxylase family protein [Clostridiales bacterium]
MKKFAALSLGVIMMISNISGTVFGAETDSETQERINAIVENIEDEFETEERESRSEEKLNELYGEENPYDFESDPEYKEIMENFLYGEVYYQGKIDDKTRELVTIASLVTNQLTAELENHINAAINIDITPVEIKEAVYQCTPYVGFGKVNQALDVVNNVFEERDVELPTEEQGTVTEESRTEDGIKQRAEIFGNSTYSNHENAAEGQEHIQYYLSGMCFGDFYTRDGLDVKTRELITLSVLASLGGCESQLKSHVQANLNVGNTKEDMIDVVTQCMPYIGFPRTLNAISCINEITTQAEN